MNAFIYFSGPLNVGLDELEDALDEALRGRGEVTGSGSGTSGSNLDLEITDSQLTPDEVLSIVRAALGKFAIPKSPKVHIQGQQYPL